MNGDYQKHNSLAAKSPPPFFKNINGKLRFLKGGSLQLRVLLKPLGNVFA